MATGTGTTSDGLTVTVQVEPAPPSPENLGDISAVFGLFLAAAVLVFCARRLLDLFNVSPNED